MHGVQCAGSGRAGLARAAAYAQQLDAEPRGGTSRGRGMYAASRPSLTTVTDSSTKEIVQTSTESLRGHERRPRPCDMRRTAAGGVLGAGPKADRGAVSQSQRGGDSPACSGGTGGLCTPLHASATAHLPVLRDDRLRRANAARGATRSRATWAAIAAGAIRSQLRGAFNSGNLLTHPLEGDWKAGRLQVLDRLRRA